MKLLLDTHAAIWWQRQDSRLSKEAMRAIATADIVWVSSATGLEVAIKVAQGRLRLGESFRVMIAADDFTELPVTLRHAEELERLPRHHAMRWRPAALSRARRRRDPARPQHRDPGSIQ